MKLFLKSLFVGIMIVSPVFIAFAQEQEVDVSNNQEQEVDVSNTQQPPNIQLVNPLGTTQTLPELIEGILRIVLTIGVPLVALAIVYAGFKFVAAQGKPEALQEARRTLLYVIIGAGILLAAYVIAEAIVETVNAIRGN